MKRAFILGALSSLVVSTAGGAPDSALIAVRAARMLDVRSGRYVERPVVVGRNGIVESVGRQVPPGARVVDVGDRTLLPGLIDAHTPVLLQGDATQAEYEHQILKEYPAHRVARAVRALKIALDHGFTTMRDLETEGLVRTSASSPGSTWS